MPVLANSKHELFAQFASKGLTAVESYVKAGYSEAGSQHNATRLMGNDGILARIKELQTAVAEQVVHAAASKRSWRVAMLQNLIDRTLSTIEARAVMYADQMGEGRTLWVVDLAGEQAAIVEGYAPDPKGDGSYPKAMIHPGYPTGAEFGMLVKDYRGKDAQQEIWKYDAAPITKLAELAKQIAIEEHQWNEDLSEGPGAAAPVKITVVFVAPEQVAGTTIDVQASR